MRTLLPATAADHATISALAHRIWPPTFADILSAAQIDYMLDMMYAPAAIAEQVKKEHIFLLLCQNSEAIGYVSYQLNYLPDTTKIHKLYLLPKQHGQGLGRYMIEAVAERARQVGQTCLRLDVNYENPAVGLYEHLGFTKIDRVDTEIGNGYLMEDWVMERAL